MQAKFFCQRYPIKTFFSFQANTIPSQQQPSNDKTVFDQQRSLSPPRSSNSSGNSSDLYKVTCRYTLEKIKAIYLYLFSEKSLISDSSVVHSFCCLLFWTDDYCKSKCSYFIHTTFLFFSKFTTSVITQFRKHKVRFIDFWTSFKIIWSSLTQLVCTYFDCYML